MSRVLQYFDKRVNLLQEIVFYIFSSSILFIILIFPVLIYFGPDTSIPDGDRIGILALILNRILEILSNLLGDRDVRQSDVGGRREFTTPNFLPVFYLVIGAVLLFLLLQGIRYVSSISANKIQQERLEKEKVSRLKFSRDDALDILQQSLKTGHYSQGIMEAYRALDDALDNFRDVSRPKHWTPKEYAYSVDEPVFQPSVYEIVNVFYKIRYAMNSGTDKDVILFIEKLQKLLINELNSTEKEKLTDVFTSKLQKWKDEQYRIPIRGDMLKPGQKFRGD